MGADQLVSGLQAAIAPFVLISGVGLIILSLTNRLGRAIDRTRELAREIKHGDHPEEAELLRPQVNVLYKRCRYLRWSIGCAAASIVCTCLITLILFSAVFFRFHGALAVQTLFALCVIFIIAALGFFLADVRLTLSSLRMEIDSLPRR